MGHSWLHTPDCKVVNEYSIVNVVRAPQLGSTGLSSWFLLESGIMRYIFDASLVPYYFP